MAAAQCRSTKRRLSKVSPESSIIHEVETLLVVTFVRAFLSHEAMGLMLVAFRAPYRQDILRGSRDYCFIRYGRAGYHPPPAQARGRGHRWR